MTGFRIAYQSDPIRPGKATAPVKDADYLDWIRTLPCLLTLEYGVEAAHLSAQNIRYGHLGRGKGQKASDRWALPLTKEMHLQSHRGSERAFWVRAHISPWIAALTLYGLWCERGEEATGIAAKLILEREIGR